jgi:hypothetical protein
VTRIQRRPAGWTTYSRCPACLTFTYT